jgi:hypothetical protein
MEVAGNSDGRALSAGNHGPGELCNYAPAVEPCMQNIAIPKSIGGHRAPTSGACDTAVDRSPALHPVIGRARHPANVTMNVLTLPLSDTVVPMILPPAILALIDDTPLSVVSVLMAVKTPFVVTMPTTVESMPRE